MAGYDLSYQSTSLQTALQLPTKHNACNQAQSNAQYRNLAKVLRCLDLSHPVQPFHKEQLSQQV